MEDIFFFILKGIVVAYVKIKYTNQTTSNNGEIDLNMCKNRSFMVISGFCDLNLDLQTDN